MRDITLSDTIYHQFTTRAFSTGVPTTLAGTPVISVLEENNVTPITAGITLNVDRGGVTGLNEVSIVATVVNGYETEKTYSIYISTGTVGGVSVVGEVVGQFTINAAPVNWARINAPTTAVDLSGTDIQLVDTATAVTNAVTVGTINANVITATSINAAALTAAKFAAGAIDANALATDAVDEIRDGLLPTQNAAFNNIMFLFVSSVDHVTPVTAATGSAVTRSIDGGAFGAGTGTLAEVANGIYQYDASAADMNGGVITFRFTATGGTPAAPDDRFVTIVTGGGV